MTRLSRVPVACIFILVGLTTCRPGRDESVNSADEGPAAASSQAVVNPLRLGGTAALVGLDHRVTPDGSATIPFSSGVSSGVYSNSVAVQVPPGKVGLT